MMEIIEIIAISAFYISGLCAAYVWGHWKGHIDGVDYAVKQFNEEN